jgi:hypothetical protein
MRLEVGERRGRFPAWQMIDEVRSLVLARHGGIHSSPNVLNVGLYQLLVLFCVACHNVLKR